MLSAELLAELGEGAMRKPCDGTDPSSRKRGRSGQDREGEDRTPKVSKQQQRKMDGLMKSACLRVCLCVCSRACREGEGSPTRWVYAIACPAPDKQRGARSHAVHEEHRTEDESQGATGTSAQQTQAGTRADGGGARAALP